MDRLIISPELAVRHEYRIIPGAFQLYRKIPGADDAQIDGSALNGLIRRRKGLVHGPFIGDQPQLSAALTYRTQRNSRTQ